MADFSHESVESQYFLYFLLLNPITFCSTDSECFVLRFCYNIHIIQQHIRRLKLL